VEGEQPLNILITAQGHAYIEFGLRIGKKLGAIKSDAVDDFYKGKSNQMMEIVEN
jgi:hypothetical protein